MSCMHVAKVLNMVITATVFIKGDFMNHGGIGWRTRSTIEKIDTIVRAIWEKRDSLGLMHSNITGVHSLYPEKRDRINYQIIVDFDTKNGPFEQGLEELKTKLLQAEFDITYEASWGIYKSYAEHAAHV